MRKFSRWMPPPRREPMTLAGWAVLTAILAGSVAAAIAWPVPVGIFLGPLIIWIVAFNVLHNGELRRLAAQRAGEDIGSFARHFDRRAEPFDPWVVRATWDALQPWARFPGGRLPLRPSDRLGEDLRIDDEEVGDQLVPEVAERAGRSLQRAESNPYWGRVVTVGDFVRFVTMQPCVAGACRGRTNRCT
jgi:hypothetical protein